MAETADSENSQRLERPVRGEEPPGDYYYTESRIYLYEDSRKPDERLSKLARRLESGRENLYLALEQLAARGILKHVEYELIGAVDEDSFDFDQLSEGKKQLIAVIGAIRLTSQRDNLVLLDEPDTHLNPQWSWEYPEMLENSFSDSQQDHSSVLIATHDPVLISGLERHQVLIADTDDAGQTKLTHPHRNPRGQGIANLLCSSEFFGLPSSLDKNTQTLMDERLRLSIKKPLTESEKQRLEELNEKLEILQPGISERDPEFVEFLRSRHESEA